MEQHNIDKRFRETVGNISRQPSPDAWARLQAQMEPVAVQEEKKNKGFWLYIAAAITLLLASVATWQFTLNNQPETGQLAATQPKAIERVEVAKSEPAAKSSEMLAQNGMEKAGKTAEATTKPENKRTVAVSPQKVKPETPVKPEIIASEKPLLAKAPKEKIQPAQAAEVTPKVLPAPQAEITKPQTEMLAAVAPVKPKAAGEELVDLNGKPVIVIVKKTSPAAEPQALAMSETPELPAEHDPVKLKDIFKQARNLKNFESVDLQDLGLQANSKLAMETRNITQKFSKVLDL